MPASEIKSKKNSRPFMSVQRLWVQWCRSYQEIPSKVKNKLLSGPSYNQKRVTKLSSPLWILEVIPSSFGCVGPAHYQAN